MDYLIFLPRRLSSLNIKDVIQWEKKERKRNTQGSACVRLIDIISNPLLEVRVIDRLNCLIFLTLVMGCKYLHPFFITKCIMRGGFSIKREDG